MGICPHHCPKGGGGGGFVLVAAAAFVLIGTQEAAIARTAALVLDAALITVASAVGLALLALGVFAGCLAWRRHAARALLAATAPGRVAARAAIEAPRRAIEAPPPSGVTVTLTARDYVRRMP